MINDDANKTGRIPVGGWRIRGKARPYPRRRTTKGVKISCVHPHSIVDEFSHLLHRAPEEGGVTAVVQISRAKARFAASGIVRFTRVVTDNGAPCRSVTIARSLAAHATSSSGPFHPWEDRTLPRYSDRGVLPRPRRDVRSPTVRGPRGLEHLLELPSTRPPGSGRQRPDSTAVSPTSRPHSARPSRLHNLANPEARVNGVRTVGDRRDASAQTRRALRVNRQIARR